MNTITDQFKGIIQHQLRWGLENVHGPESELKKRLDTDFRAIGHLLLREQAPGTEAFLWMDAYLKNEPSRYLNQNQKSPVPKSAPEPPKNWKAFEEAGFTLSAGKPWTLTSLWIRQAASISGGTRENQSKEVFSDFNAFFLAADSAKLKMELLAMMGKIPKLSKLVLNELPHPGKKLWTFKTDGEMLASPTVANGRVYAGSRDESLYCLDARTGKRYWTFETAGEILSSAVVSEGRVYLGSADGSVYSLDAESGSKLWSFKTRNSVMSTPLVSSGNVYFGSDDQHVYCLDARTGKRKWAFPTKGGVGSSPVEAEGRLYIGSDDQRLYCLDPAAGKKIWSFETDAAVTTPTAVHNGRVYCGNDNGTLLGLSAETGEQLSKIQVPGGAVQAVVANNRLYFRSFYEKAVLSFSLPDFKAPWAFRDAELGVSSPAVADGQVYFGSLDSRLYCLDAWRGRKLWSFQAGGEIWFPPVVEDGRIYFGSLDGNIYCLSS